ncbi:hypothetical protein [Ruegeria sp. HKCCE4148]|uniref:hypothetical protein n=1 Tax=Ruegeria sp. HKCCE4148 TaxID=2794829 RepID=UPI001AE3939D|nr:hypothetical protein [Ruegeria sp. HKCCE4148]
MRLFALVAAMVVLVTAAFWAGARVQLAVQEDNCLDLGGGRHPGDYPVCVVERFPDWLSIGPIALMPAAVREMSTEETGNEQVILRLELNKDAAFAVAGLTRAKIGKDLELRVGNRMVSAVTVREEIANRRWNLILPKEAADLAVREYQ